MSPLRAGHFGSKEQSVSSKVELDVVREACGHKGKSVSAIVKVSTADYVPKGVQLRVRLSPVMFTAQITQRILKRLETDPQVVSISLSSRLATVG